MKEQEHYTIQIREGRTWWPRRTFFAEHDAVMDMRELARERGRRYRVVNQDGACVADSKDGIEA